MPGEKKVLETKSMVNIGETRFRTIPGVRIKRLRAGK